MFEEYYREPEPAKRKKILDAYVPEDFDQEKLEQMKRLFEIRYSVDKNGVWADCFVRSFLELRMIAENMESVFASRRNKKMGTAALERLCLNRQEEFAEDVLYRELCHVTAVYISACTRDKNYTSFIWGLGKISDKKTVGKIRYDMQKVGEDIPKYLNAEEACRILSRAVKDTAEKMLEDL
ncbi:MAG: hypothetical protein LUD71_04575 [Clostridiales bacterium]|nr:hypothetical protein [Clostridiales bacterium]